jgi:hypothetical protein
VSGAEPELLSQAQFARLIGVDRSYVTRLKHDGRLVMRGKRVVVDDSRRRIEATAGGRIDVSDRHAEARAGNGTPAPLEWGAAGAALVRMMGDHQVTAPAVIAAPEPAVPEALPPAAADPPAGDERTLEAWRELRVKSEARRLQAQADTAEIERDRLAGRLMDVEDVDRAARDLGAAVRAAMDNYPDQVAPLVAPVAELDQVHQILAEQCRNVLQHVVELIERQIAARRA